MIIKNKTRSRTGIKGSNEKQGKIVRYSKRSCDLGQKGMRVGSD
jgi:hypothetical protein